VKIGIAAGFALTLSSCMAPSVALGQYLPIHTDGCDHGSASRAWKSASASNAEELTITHRLVGLGCGPARLTYTAVEEDEFPAPCYAIDTPEAMCPVDDTEPVLAWECAAYLGDGW